MRVAIDHFTDPTCPWAFSAERQRLRIAWLYGDQVDWTTRMVVLSRTPEEPLARGFTVQLLAKGLTMIQARYGMPIATEERPRHAASVVGCRAFVAANRHAPDAAEALLRRLRVHHMAGTALIDEPDAIATAAREAGIAPDDLAAWMAEPATEAQLEADAAAARAPGAASVHLRHKLAPNGDGWRYTCPSWVASADGRSLELPGFQPVESYEVAIANLAPGLARRAEPTDVAEVLAWAPYPLATAEVAAVMGREPEDVREALAQAATFAPSGLDGYWSLPA